MKRILFVLVLLTGSGCTNQKDATRILQENGYTNIEMTGYRWFLCGRDDWYHTGFRATHYAQQPITGAVCSGLLFKGSTIRFD